MNAIAGLVLRVALFALLYLFLFIALRLIWKSVNQKTLRVGSVVIPLLELSSPDVDNATPKSFSSAEVLIGRDADCDFVISLPAVSSRHGRFSYHQNQWWYEDLKSTNGSFLEDLRVEEPIVIKDGDLVYLGDIEIAVRITPTV